MWWRLNPEKSFELRRVGKERAWDEYGVDDDLLVYLFYIFRISQSGNLNEEEKT